MEDNDINKRLGILVILGLGIVAVIMVMNARIQDGLRQITTPAAVNGVFAQAPAAPPGKPETAARYRKRGQKIVRQDRLSPGRDYMESIFYLEGRELARQKIIDEKVLESSGEIPEGRVDFVNEFKKTHGVEYYARGRKDGASRTYFADGRLNVEAYYRHGELSWKKEYYHDGGLRLEVDYQDARPLGGEKETGTGKVYFRDGTLKYEWHFTKSDPTAFRRSYNQNGELTAAFYFDENGQRMPGNPNLSIIP